MMLSAGLSPSSLLLKKLSQQLSTIWGLFSGVHNCKVAPLQRLPCSTVTQQ